MQWESWNALLWCEDYHTFWVWPYLLGTRFQLQTDHSPLVFLAKAKDNQHVIHWALSLQDYDFDIIHLKSSQNILADALSRIYSGEDM